MLDSLMSPQGPLFGRKDALAHLRHRARQRGLTAVVGPPMIGKSSVLRALGRDLMEGDEYLVGYRESTGQENSHLLYAIGDLYTRWLQQSSFTQQAASLWQRHKGELIPRLGRAAGALYKHLTDVAPEAVRETIATTFDGLEWLNSDLKSGGLDLPALPYDQAQALAALVARISGKRIVLILDAWGAPQERASEYHTLETFLTHRFEWPEMHLFVGVRSARPDLNGGDSRAIAEANALAARSRAAEIYSLPPLELGAAGEKERLVDFVHENVPASRLVNREGVLALIDGFPGVLNFWLDEVNNGALKDAGALRTIAEDAHALRYTELARALRELGKRSTPALDVCARLAFLPRLGPETWETCRRLVLADEPENVLDPLGSILSAPIPTFGHATRHEAARRALLQDYPHLMHRVAENLVHALASGISAPPEDVLGVAILGSRTDVVRQIGCSESIQFMVAAARSVARDPSELASSTIDAAQIVALGRSSPPLVPLLAMGLVNRGYDREGRELFSDAIVDFSAALDLPNAPLWPAGLAYLNRGDCKRALRDFEGAIADYSAVLAIKGVWTETRARAHIHRAHAYGLQDAHAQAIADYTAAIETPEVPVHVLAVALNNRGMERKWSGDLAGALSDLTAVIDLDGAPPNELMHALVNRGECHGDQRDWQAALSDLGAGIDLPEQDPTLLSRALAVRGACRCEVGDFKGAIEDYSRAIDSNGLTPESLSRTLVGRALARIEVGDVEGARSDLEAVTGMPISPSRVAEAAREMLVTLGVAQG